jgi:hypothetical protein
MFLGRHTCTGELITLGRNIIYLSILTITLMQTYFTSDLITLGRNNIYHSFLTNARRQTYLYK